VSAEIVPWPLVDETRGRSLPTDVHLPGADVPWPLVAFAHGWMGHPRKFSRLFASWAAAGYAVAAPTFPNTNEASSGRDFDDVQNQPADLRFVLDSLLEDSRFDSTRVAAAGFSLGAVTALAVAFESSQRDPRIAAVVAISGRLRWFGGRYGLDGSPLLVVHGKLDPVVEYEGGLDVYRRALPPKALLTVLIPGHSEFVQDEPPTEADALVADVTRAFLDSVLGRSPVPPPRVEAELAALDSEGIW
jgi:predicted dienelactone hydrolase